MGFTPREEIPEQCRICEAGCASILICNPSYCLGSNVLIILVFGLIGIPVFIRLIQFYTREKAGSTLKKIIYILATIMCGDRVLRHGLMQGEVQTMGKVGRWFDLIFYWAAMYCLIAIYSTLLLFWDNLCRNNGTARTWLTNNMKRTLIVINIVAFIFLVGIFPAVNVLLASGLGNLLVNILIGLTLLAFTIAYMVEGIRVYRLIKSFSIEKHSKDDKTSSMLTSITITVIAASVTVIVALLVIAITNSGVFSTANDYDRCQTLFLVYRAIEVAVLLFIVIPLRGIRKGRDGSGGSSTDRTTKASPSTLPASTKSNSMESTQGSTIVEVSLSEIPLVESKSTETIDVNIESASESSQELDGQEEI
eukprot:TRINITY_DN13025_c0_g1_i1.p1 TRINITY_DN13025_c0_g1~~TRINITY_DN13025_c0_g1_i1.p1  ORF type:complete len:365 (+),score=74.12 TRINITY_DN13025_c0_g1_i1:50-1144(+)